MYSSLPLSGPRREEAEAVLAGERLALRRAGGRVGRFSVRHASLDDATPDGWRARDVAVNARRAVDDATTIAYLGELESAATGVSAPILNLAGILQVPSLAGAVGLTRRSGQPGEPARYRPDDTRTLGRVVPADGVQARALLAAAEEGGARRVLVVVSDDAQGRALAAQLQRAARGGPVEVAAVARVGAGGDVAAAAERSAGAAEADGVVVAVGDPQAAARAWPRLARLAGRPLLVAGAELAQPAVLDALGEAAGRTTAVSPALPPARLPPRGRAFAQAYEEQTGSPPPPAALFGYEAMDAVLDAMRRAGTEANCRVEVTNEFMRTRDREGAVGRYSIDDNGDTTLVRYGIYAVRGGRLRLEEVVDAR